MRWTLIVQLILKLLIPMLSVITPVLKEELETWLLEFYAKALETENPWDDFVAGFLLDIFSIPRPD